MQPTRFDAQVRARAGTTVLDLSGQLDREADAALTAAFDGALATRQKAVLLNFADVGYINSTGIALIVGLLGRAQAEQVVLTACGLSDHYREIFEITRLTDFIRLYIDEADAFGEVTTPTA